MERALKLTRKELTALLGEDQPAIADQPEKEKAWIGPWNELWGATRWPSVSPRMACAIQAALDMGRDMLESALDSSNFDPEEWPVLEEFDSRVFIEVGENKPWYRALAERMRHLVDAMSKGQLIDESCECFADAALFGAAVRHAIAGWEETAETWPGVSNAPVGSHPAWPTAGRRPALLHAFSPIWPAIFLIDLANSSERTVTVGVHGRPEGCAGPADNYSQTGCSERDWFMSALVSRVAITASSKCPGDETESLQVPPLTRQLFPTSSREAA